MLAQSVFDWLLIAAYRGEWHPTRGIQQGDPLSLYIFILCQNILSLMLLKAQEDEEIKGIHITRSSPSLNHLFFAGDWYIFYQANVHSCRKIKYFM